MNGDRSLGEIGLYFTTLSLVAIGGANALIPEMHRHLVELNGWMSSKEFVALVALSQAAPGPNVLIVSLLGWKVAGVAGALIATAAMCIPSSMLVYGFTRVWDRFRHAPWRIAVQTGLAAITVGLILASGYVLARGAAQGWGSYVITGVTALLVLKTRLHPLLLLVAAGAVGYFGVI